MCAACTAALTDPLTVVEDAGALITEMHRLDKKEPDVAALGTVTIPVKADTAGLAEVLRIIAKHAQACADELELSTRKEED